MDTPIDNFRDSVNIVIRRIDQRYQKLFSSDAPRLRREILLLRGQTAPENAEEEKIYNQGYIAHPYDDRFIRVEEGLTILKNARKTKNAKDTKKGGLRAAEDHAHNNQPRGRNQKIPPPPAYGNGNLFGH